MRPSLLASPTGRGRDGVQGDVLEPVGVEHERRVLELLDRLDDETRLEEDPAAQLRRSRDLEASRRALGGAHVHRLTEQVEEPEEEDDREQGHEHLPNDRTRLPVGEVSVVLQGEPLRNRHHCAFRRARGGFLPRATFRLVQVDCDECDSGTPRRPGQPPKNADQLSCHGFGSGQWTEVAGAGDLGNVGHPRAGRPAAAQHL